jgi:glucose-6-phosphate 1-epimerase
MQPETQANATILDGQFADLPALLIETPFSKAAISLFGAHVLSFAPRGESDWLWLSQRLAPLPTPIRGGIPICWPWFAKEGRNPNDPQHGYARTAAWIVSEQRIDPRGSVRLVLKPSVSLVPGIDVQLTITIAEMLHMSLLTVNQTQDPFVLSQAFHTYLSISNCNHCAIDGLENLNYLDKLESFANKEQIGVFCESAPFDRIYQNTAGLYQILDRTSGSLRLMASTGSKTAVVWNPGELGGQSMADVGAQWPSFVCVEVANARDDTITLQPGQRHTMSMALS